MYSECSVGCGSIQNPLFGCPFCPRSSVIVPATGYPFRFASRSSSVGYAYSVMFAPPPNPSRPTSMLTVKRIVFRSGDPFTGGWFRFTSTVPHEFSTASTTRRAGSAFAPNTVAKLSDACPRLTHTMFDGQTRVSRPPR